MITGLDVEDIYEIPIIFEEEALPEIIHKKLNIYSPPDLRKWRMLIESRRLSKPRVKPARNSSP